jgi:hypothetical protein
MRRFGSKTADGAEAVVVAGKAVEKAGVGNTKEGEEKEGEKRPSDGG